MKIHKMAIITMMVLISQVTYGQVTVDDNVPVFGRWVGFNNNSGIPLPIENRGFDEINISSNLRTKIAITELPVWNGLNGLTRNNVQRTSMGLSGDDDDAWSMLHLMDQDGVDAFFNTMRRSWMNVGTSYTANLDFMYTGLMERPTPGIGPDTLRTDAVIAWGCQPGVDNADNFRILFIRPQISTGPGTDLQGLETMRITPWGNVGIGDSYSNALQPHRRTVVHERTDSAQFRIAWGVNTDPVLGQHADFQVTDNGVLHIKNRDNNARRPVVVGFLENEDANPTAFTYLDVGGITRIRDLREDDTKTCLVLGTFADTTAQGDSADHYLTRLDFPQDPTLFLAGDATWQPASGEDCRWEDVNSGTTSGNIDLRTGFNTNSDCYRDKVVIGANGAKEAKLESWSRQDRDNINRAIYARAAGAGESSSVIFSGIIAETEGTAGAINSVYVGAFGNAGYIGEYGRQNVGVRGEANADQGGQAIGVYAKAEGLGDQIGIYAEGNTAVLFLGSTNLAMMPLILSDETLKEEVTDIENASSLLNQLSPKSYYMTSPDNRNLYLTDKLQYGLIAQEVQEVLPNIVEDVAVPAQFDTTGVIEGTELSLLGVQYEALIPILVAGFQEQNAQMAAQILENETLEAKVASLSEQLQSQATQMAEIQEQMTQVMSSFQSTQSKMNNCCGTAPNEKSKSETGVRLRSPSGDVNLEQNFPNPFEAVTTINFSINEPAQIRLEISDSQGRVLDVLINASMDKGEYTERWDGSAVAPGTYYYSLYANTELLTKKMIKK